MLLYPTQGVDRKADVRSTTEGRCTGVGRVEEVTERGRGFFMIILHFRLHCSSRLRHGRPCLVDTSLVYVYVYYVCYDVGHVSTIDCVLCRLDVG